MRCSRYKSRSSAENCARNSGLAPLLISRIKSIISLLLINLLHLNPRPKLLTRAYRTGRRVFLNCAGGGVQIEPEAVRHYMSCTFVGVLHHIVAGKRGGRGHFETSNNSGAGAARNVAEICDFFLPRRHRGF